MNTAEPLAPHYVPLGDTSPRDRLRAEWTSLVAHDLRQPLNVISLSAHALARGSAACPDRGTDELDRIRKAVMTMGRMISDLLDASSIEARGLEMECVPVKIAALAHEAVASVAGLAERCEISVEAGADVFLRADPGRVVQVLANLLGNAMKYGEPGTPILVDVARTADDVRVTVSNRGPGIPAPELSRVFERFRRGRSTRRGRQGLGLGLYIAKELIEAHGGRIWAKSAPGVITQFVFTLPLEVTG
jgi:signal transduction histidine kinase